MMTITKYSSYVVAGQQPTAFDRIPTLAPVVAAAVALDSQRELASISGLEPMHVSKPVRALERAGLVERAGNPDDTRAVQLNVTARGIQVVTAAREKVIELEDRRLAPLGGRRSEQSAELRDTLLTLLGHAEAMNTGRDGEPAVR